MPPIIESLKVQAQHRVHSLKVVERMPTTPAADRSYYRRLRRARNHALHDFWMPLHLGLPTVVEQTVASDAACQAEFPWAAPPTKYVVIEVHSNNV